MALRCRSSTGRQDLGLLDSPLTDSPPPTSQGGSSNGAEADVARNTKEEVDHLLAKFEKEGLEIDGKIASVIDDGIARIKAEAVRENISEPKREAMVKLITIASVAVGFIMGWEWQENYFHKEFAKRCRP